ncbi:hypothetical protein BHE74_00037052, partial [Ensete ventricosum]
DWVIQDLQSCNIYALPLRIQKDALAFQLLRLHGYDVSPRKFCWFMDDEEMLIYIEENYSQFLVAMAGVYRAAHFMFPTEVELHNAKLFSVKILQKGSSGSDTRNNPAIKTDLQKQVKEPTAIRVWSKDSGLSSMGFGREKTAYCYFLIATAVTLPLQSDLRKVVARCGKEKAYPAIAKLFLTPLITLFVIFPSKLSVNTVMMRKAFFKIW